MVRTNTNSEPRYPQREGFTGHKPEENSPRISEATSAAAAPVKQRVMKERMAPVLLEFKYAGDLLEGELLSVDKIKIKDKATGQPKVVMQYTFAGADGGTVKCLGTYDLNTKLRPSDVGLWVEICFKDVDASKNNMHVFSVKIEEKPKAAFSDGLVITDEDIPF